MNVFLLFVASLFFLVLILFIALVAFILAVGPDVWQQLQVLR